MKPKATSEDSSLQSQDKVAPTTSRVLYNAKGIPKSTEDWLAISRGKAASISGISALEAVTLPVELLPTSGGGGQLLKEDSKSEEVDEDLILEEGTSQDLADLNKDKTSPASEYGYYYPDVVANAQDRSSNTKHDLLLLCIKMLLCALLEPLGSFVAFMEFNRLKKPPGEWKTLIDVVSHVRRSLLDLTGDESNAVTVLGANFSAGFVVGSLAAAATCLLDVAQTRRQIEANQAIHAISVENPSMASTTSSPMEESGSSPGKNTVRDKNTMANTNDLGAKVVDSYIVRRKQMGSVHPKINTSSSTSGTPIHSNLLIPGTVYSTPTRFTPVKPQELYPLHQNSSDMERDASIANTGGVQQLASESHSQSSSEPNKTQGTQSPTKSRPSYTNPTHIVDESPSPESAKSSQSRNPHEVVKQESVRLNIEGGKSEEWQVVSNRKASNQPVSIPTKPPTKEWQVIGKAVAIKKGGITDLEAVTQFVPVTANTVQGGAVNNALSEEDTLSDTFDEEIVVLDCPPMAGLAENVVVVPTDKPFNSIEELHTADSCNSKKKDIKERPIPEHQYEVLSTPPIEPHPKPPNIVSAAGGLRATEVAENFRNISNKNIRPTGQELQESNSARKRRLKKERDLLEQGSL
ncbi:hypothetical protein Vadar_000294 [Vaccinium darrowii]|uniref:Uncharacterized protein n=1 Tax=Vaccinium darrowii TaxID=229202 RepID=A0ACB7XM31_9ERIC|nr:hypothetical protein Vadar_000294 [Vaccinium darrowii]